MLKFAKAGAQTQLSRLVLTSPLEMLASYPQKSSALGGRIAGRKREIFRRIILQVIQPFCLFTEIDHQFAGLVPNRHQARPHPVSAPERIGASFDTFHDHRFARHFSSDDLRPKAASLKICWSGQAKCVQESGCEMKQAERRWHAVLPCECGCIQQQRYVNQLLRKAVRGMIAGAVFEEFFPMIGGDREY